ncbi:hypothetical protein MNBD_GAMMA18-1284 [hydrothermal vent metagenome]|uniref:Flagellar assembly protein FliH/Type III secretion system HrpE domain-containing protein n=1 Tax=hydrothermal vent metagenome TaxID=652676 RepID=A0A3B0Z8D2_9ZZZZ
MSKGREVVFTRALDDDECHSVQPFSFKEMRAGKEEFHSLNERDEEKNSNQGLLENIAESGALTVEKLEALQQQVYQESYDKGLAEGRTAGVEQALAEQRQQAAGQAQKIQSILEHFSAPLQDLDDTILDELTTMVTTIAKHFIRRELKHDPGQIIAVTREALAILPLNSRHIRLHLHPDDAALVRDTLAVSEEESPWRIIEDGTLSRGGLKVTAENSQIDATVESRFAEVISRILGDEREPEGE